MRTSIFLILFTFSALAQTDSNLLADDISLSIERLNTEISEDSGRVDSYLKLAGVYYELNMFMKASGVLLNALERDTLNSKIYLMLGSAYLAAEQYYDARPVLEKALSLDSSNIQAILKTGRVYQFFKEWQKGKLLFEKLVSIESQNPNYFEQLARFEEALKEYDNALVHLQTANRLNRRNISTTLRLAALYFKTDRVISALREADRGLEIFPDNTEILRMKADAHFKLEEFNEAAKSYGKLVLLGDTSAIVYRNLGISYYATDSTALADAYLDTAFSKNDKDEVTALYLGVNFREMGDDILAEEYLRKVAELNVSKYEIESYIQLASLFEYQKDYANAVEYYKLALEKDPSRISVKFRLASVIDKYYADKRQALALYEDFVEDSANADPTMLKYAAGRIEEIKEEMFFSR